MIAVWISSCWLTPSTLPNKMCVRCCEVWILVNRTKPMANIPENTIPIAVSSLIRLFSLNNPPLKAQAIPETNAPITNGIPAKKLRQCQVEQHEKWHRPSMTILSILNSKRVAHRSRQPLMPWVAHLHEGKLKWLNENGEHLSHNPPPYVVFDWLIPYLARIEKPIKITRFVMLRWHHLLRHPDNSLNRHRRKPVIAPNATAILIRVLNLSVSK